MNDVSCKICFVGHKLVKNAYVGPKIIQLSRCGLPRTNDPFLQFEGDFGQSITCQKASLICNSFADHVHRFVFSFDKRGKVKENELNRCLRHREKEDIKRLLREGSKQMLTEPGLEHKQQRK